MPLYTHLKVRLKLLLSHYIDGEQKISYKSNKINRHGHSLNCNLNTRLTKNPTLKRWACFFQDTIYSF